MRYLLIGSWLLWELLFIYPNLALGENSFKNTSAAANNPHFSPTVKLSHIQPSGHWRYWTTADGLRETCGLCQVGADGKIWIRHGAVDQLSCLDGYSVQKLPSPGVWLQVFESRSHQLWSLDSHGVKLLQEGAWKTFPIPGFDFSTVKILPGGRDHLFLCYNNRLLEFDAALNSSTLIKYATETILGAFNNIQTSPTGDVLLAGDKGAAKIVMENHDSAVGAAWKEYPFPPEFGLVNLDYIMEDEEGQIYGSAFSLQTNHRVLLQLDGETWRINYVSDQDINAGWPGVDQSFWLWKSNDYYPSLDYLTEWNGEIQESSVQLPSLTSIQLPSLERGTPIVYESRRSFWLSLSPGIARYAPAVWRTPEVIARLNENINAICEDPQRRLWFTSFNKLLLLQDAEWKIYSLPPGISTYQWEPNGLAYLKNGHIAIRTVNSILLTFDPETEAFHAVTHPQGRKISWIFPRSDGTIWVQAEDKTSTRQKFVYSLEIYDGETFRLFLDRGDQWNIEQLRYIYEDPQGSIWLGGMKDERVAIYRNGDYRILGKEYPGDSVMCIFPMENRRLWFSDRNSIYEYDGTRWTTVRTNLDGIPAIIRSRDGVIWVATWNGLYRFFRNSWVQNSEEEGLSSFCILKVLEDSRGRIWAATSRGLCLYHPNADPDPPKVFIDPEANAAVLAPDAVAQFVYSGIDKWKYTPQNRLLYSHRIDDGAWSPYTEKTVANYPNLTSGAHQFAVKVMDRNGNESLLPAVFAFSVLKHWYREPGFLILLICGSLVTLSAVGYAISRHINLEKLVTERTTDLQTAHQNLLAYKQQLQLFASEISLIEERDRRQIAEDLHDRIGHGLAACQMQIETLQRSELDAEHSHLLETIRQMLEETIQDVRSLTFEISPPVLHELGLAPALEWLVEQMEKQHGMRIELHDDGRNKPLSVDARGVLFRSTRELLFNVLKHSKTLNAKVTILQENGKVRLTVEDDGIGFDVSQIHYHGIQRHSFGLFSIRERIEYLGGSFECESAPERGTRITLTISCGDESSEHSSS